MGNFKYFLSTFFPSLAHFPHLLKGDKNLSSVYLIGPLSKSYTVMFAKALINCKEPIMVKGIIYSI